MDALNRSLSWELASVLPHCMRQLSRHGDALDNLLAHAVHNDSATLAQYFPRERVSDLLAIASFMDLGSQTFLLVDLLLLLLVFTQGPLDDKIDYLFAWFSVSNNGSLDEHELLYMLTKLRFCVRKLGLKSLEYSASDLEMAALAARMRTDPTNASSTQLLPSLSKEDFRLWVASSAECGTLLRLVAAFRELNAVMVTMQARVALLQRTLDAMRRDAALVARVPAPPLYASDVLLSEVRTSVYLSYVGRRAASLCCPFVSTSYSEVYVKIARQYSIDEEGIRVLGPQARSKYSSYAVYNRYSVRRGWMYMRIDVDGLEPDTVYELTVYTDTLKLPAVECRTVGAPSDLSDGDLVVLSSLIDAKDSTIRAILRPLSPATIVFTGPLCSLNTVFEHTSHDSLQTSLAAVCSAVSRDACRNLEHLFSLSQLPRRPPIHVVGTRRSPLVLFDGGGSWDACLRRSPSNEAALRGLGVEDSFRRGVVAEHSRCFRAIAPSPFESQRGIFKLVCIDTAAHSADWFGGQLDGLKIELDNAALASQTSHVLVLMRDPKEMLFLLAPPVLAAVEASSVDVLTRLSGRFELEHGAYTEEVGARTGDTRVFLNALLDVLSAWVANNSSARTVTLVSTAWDQGYNFTLHREPDIAIRHESLLRTRPPSSDALADGGILALVRGAIGDSYAISVGAESGDRSLLFRAGEGGAVVSLPLQTPIAPIAPIEADQRRPFIALSSPSIVALTSTRVELSVECAGERGALHLTLFALPWSASHLVAEYLVREERSQLRVLSTRRLRHSKSNDLYTVAFCNLAPNAYYAVLCEPSAALSLLASFRTMPRDQVMSFSCMLSHRMRKESPFCTRFSYPLPVLESLSLKSPTSYPLLSLDFTATSDEPSAASPSSSLHSMALALPNAVASKSNLHVQGHCCFACPSDASPTALTALCSRLEDALLMQHISVLIVCLAEPIPICLLKTASIKSIGQYGTTAKSECERLLGVLFRWNSLPSRTSFVVSYGLVADSLYFRFESKKFSYGVAHIVVPCVRGSASSHAFATGRCSYSEDMTYEGLPIGSAASLIVDLPSLETSTSNDESLNESEQLVLLPPNSVFVSYSIEVFAQPSIDAAPIAHHVHMRGMLQYMADICDIVGPTIGHVTSTSATILFEFSTDLASVACVLSSGTNSSEVLKADVKAFTPAYFIFEDLLPGKVYSITIPSLRSTRVGRLLTPLSHPDSIELCFISDGALDENRALDVIAADVDAHCHFDMRRLLPMLSTCFGDVKWTPPFLQPLLREVLSPVSASTSLIHLHQPSLLLHKSFTGLAGLIERWRCEPTSSYYTETLYRDECIEFVRDSFRAVASVPGLDRLLCNVPNEFVPFPLEKGSVQHSSNGTGNDAVVDDIVTCVAASRSVYLYNICPLEDRHGVLVERIGSFAKIRLSGSTESGYLSASQIERFKAVLLDPRLAQLVVYSEFIVLTDGLPVRLSPNSSHLFDVEDFTRTLFEWLQGSKPRESRSIAFVCRASSPFVSELRHTYSGMKMYQFCVGKLFDSGEAHVDIDCGVYDATIGLAKLRHFIGELPPSLLCNCSGSSPCLAPLMQASSFRYGYATLRTWVDNANPSYEWKLVRNHDFVVLSPALVLGPMLGTAYLSTSGEFWVPVLWESDRDTDITVECVNVFTSAPTLFSISLKRHCPAALHIGPLELNSRFYCRITCGAEKLSAHDFFVSTFNSSNESNFIFLNARKPSSSFCSYDFISDLTTRSMVPFHGVTGVVHLNAGIDPFVLIDRILESDHASMLKSCREERAMSKAMHVFMSHLLDRTRAHLRDELCQPSYRELCKHAFNIFMPNQCELSTAMRGSEIERLVAVVLSYCHQLYFGKLSIKSPVAAHAIDSEEEDCFSSLFEQWLDTDTPLLRPSAWSSPNEMMTIEAVDLLDVAAVEDVLTSLSFAKLSTRIRTIVIENGPRSSTSPVLDLFNTELPIGYRFQAAVKEWTSSNPSRKLLLLSAIDNQGTALRTLPVEFERLEPISVYFLNSSYRSNRFLHNAKLAEIEENFKSLSTPSAGKNLAAVKRRQEEARLLEATLKRKSDEIWDSLLPDGYLVVECRYDDVSATDIGIGSILSFDVSVLGSRGLDDVSKHFELMQPPTWLPLYIPNDPGVFVVDEILLYARSSPENKSFLSFLEEDATAELIKHMYLESKLFAILQTDAVAYMRGVNPSVPRCVFDLINSVWTDLIPLKFRELLSCLSDPLIAAYCIGGARVLDYVHDADRLSEAMQMALVYCLCFKTCQQMRRLKRWNSAAFATNVADNTSLLEKVSFADSDLADISREEEEAVAVEKPPEKVTLNFKKESVATVTRKVVVDEEDEYRERLGKLKEELEQQRSKRVEKLKVIGIKMSYIQGFEVPSTGPFEGESV